MPPRTAAERDSENANVCHRTEHLVLRVQCDRRNGAKLKCSLFDEYGSTQENIVNKDQLKGRLKKAEGTIKEVAGKVIRDKELEDKGRTRKTLGKIQAIHGDLKEDLGKIL